MQIFDFTDRDKGMRLGSCNLISQHLEKSWKIDRFTYVPWGSPIIPEDYGVEAVCFCTGSARGSWVWWFTATEAWLAENREHPDF